MEKKVLIVEDDAFILETIAKRFRAEGFNILLAKNAAAVTSVLSTETPDIILLDIILPEVNGFEILKQLKADPKTQSIPVIIFSNLDSKQDVKQAMEIGAADYLVKASLSPTEVINKVNNLLAK